MTTRPWMPLYIADYLADTAHLGALQSGAYLHLIMHYWVNGSLPADEAALARIARLTPSEWRRHRETLQPFFHDGWHHKRIDAELAHVRNISDKRRAAAEQRHNKSNANGHANAEQKDTHSHSHKKDINLGNETDPARASEINGHVAKAARKAANGAKPKSNYMWLKIDDTRVPQAKAWWRDNFGPDVEMPLSTMPGGDPGYRVPWEALNA